MHTYLFNIESALLVWLVLRVARWRGWRVKEWHAVLSLAVLNIASWYVLPRLGVWIYYPPVHPALLVLAVFVFYTSLWMFVKYAFIYRRWFVGLVAFIFSIVYLCFGLFMALSLVLLCAMMFDMQRVMR